MVKAKFSKNAEAIRSRIRRLPELYTDALQAVQRGDADRTEKYFREGILGRSLRLKALTENTIKRKMREGKPRPHTPLYGVGPGDENSYANMMEVTEVPKGKGKQYVVKPKDEQHHESELNLRDLFIVHEYGAVIDNAFGKGITVRIPPRPAMRYAFRKVMRERAKRDDATEVRKAINRYVRQGDRRALDLVKKRAQK